MSKIYKGYELLKAIADGEIKKGTEFIVRTTKFYYDGSIFRYKNNYCGIEANSEIGMSWLTNNWELIEDEVDIDNIEELNDICYHEMTDDNLEYYHNRTRTTINELVQAVKQLNKEIKELRR